MKSYKDYEKIYIGSSDLASLTIVAPRENGEQLAQSLYFGIDSNYFAYIVDSNAHIGNHYNLAQTCKHWLKVFDDEGLTLKLKAKTIKIYRAGDCGCIFQCLED